MLTCILFHLSYLYFTLVLQGVQGKVYSIIPLYHKYYERRYICIKRAHLFKPEGKLWLLFCRLRMVPVYCLYNTCFSTFHLLTPRETLWICLTLWSSRPLLPQDLSQAEIFPITFHLSPANWRCCRSGLGPVWVFCIPTSSIYSASMPLPFHNGHLPKSTQCIS